MVLSDQTSKEEIAKGRVVIEPLNPACIQPASIDTHLDNKLLVFKTWRHPFYIDVRENSYVDTGWHEHLTLELSNVAKLPVTLYYKVGIGQISFLRLTSPAERLYGLPELGSKYQGHTGPTPTRYYEGFGR